MTDTRTRLKEAALSLFLARGYGKTTIGAIEKAAGLAPRAGGFYRHFESKEALLVAIAREDIIEQEGELGFTDFFPLGDTRAELLLIGRGYLKANERQKKYYPLIQEMRAVPALAEFEQAANVEIFSLLADWVASKPAGKNLKGEKLAAYVMTVFGGLLFYTTKRLQGISLPGLSDEAMVQGWASHWAQVLDARPPKRQSRKAG